MPRPYSNYYRAGNSNLEISASIEPGLHGYYEANSCFEENHLPYLAALKWIVENNLKSQEGNNVLFQRIKGLQKELKEKLHQVDKLKNTVREQDLTIRRLRRRLTKSRHDTKRLNKIILSSTKNIRRGSIRELGGVTEISSIAQNEDERYTIVSSHVTSDNSFSFSSHGSLSEKETPSDDNNNNSDSESRLSSFSLSALSPSSSSASIQITFGQGEPEFVDLPRVEDNFQQKNTGCVSMYDLMLKDSKSIDLKKRTVAKSDSSASYHSPLRAIADYESGLNWVTVHQTSYSENSLDELSMSMSSVDEDADRNKHNFSNDNDEMNSFDDKENQIPGSIDSLLDRTAATLISTLSSGESSLHWKQFKPSNIGETAFKIIRVDVEFRKKKLPCKHFITQVKDEATCSTKNGPEKMYRVSVYNGKEQRVDGKAQYVFVEPILPKSYICDIQDVVFHLPSPIVLRRGGLIFNCDLKQFNIPMR